MIIITGATGQLGSQIVDHLLARVPVEQVGVSVRDVDKAGDLAARGVRVRHGDFSDAESLATAFEGASQVLVVSVDTLGERSVAQHATAIDAAYRAGAGRVLYTSHQAANLDSSFAPARDHAATEDYLAACGRPFTALRNGFYTTSLPYLIGDAAQTGELVTPAGGPVSWTAPADLAEGVAAVLAGEGRFDGPTPPLTATDAVDMQDLAAVISEVSGRAVRRVLVDDEDWVAGLVERGVPDPAARLLLGAFHASRRGEFAVTDPTLEKLLGRPTTPVRSVFEVASSQVI